MQIERTQEEVEGRRREEQGACSRSFDISEMENKGAEEWDKNRDNDEKELRSTKTSKVSSLSDIVKR